jgi:hypothetical protein
VAASVILLWCSPRPPEPPETTPEEEAVRQRLVGRAIRDAQRWQAERGDVVIPWDEARGHLAIIIDDTGRELSWHEKLQALPYRLTFSVLPGAGYAAGAQLRLRQDHRRYREILLHLPMEPVDAAAMHAGAEAREEFLLLADSDAELAAKIARALARVPAAVGVNNHMGSRLTADERAMRVTMAALRERGLFFLDSRTTADTVAERTALAERVVALPRDAFLDHDPTPQAVRAALAEAGARSLREPTVVIAHPSDAVVTVLGEELPRLAASGVGVYPLSELVVRRRALSAGG